MFYVERLSPCVVLYSPLPVFVCFPAPPVSHYLITPCVFNSVVFFPLSLCLFVHFHPSISVLWSCLPVVFHLHLLTALSFFCVLFLFGTYACVLLFCYLSASERLDQLLHCRDRKGFKNPHAAKQTIFPSRVLEEDFWKYVHSSLCCHKTFSSINNYSLFEKSDVWLWLEW